MPREYTRVSAITYRDPAQSTTDTIFIRFTLALDTSLQFTTHLAWEDYPTFPDKCPNEEVEYMIACIVHRIHSLTEGKVINSREKRLSCVAMIFNSCPVEGMNLSENMQLTSNQICFKRHGSYTSRFCESTCWCM